MTVSPSISVGRLVDALEGRWVQGGQPSRSLWTNARIDSRMIEDGEVFVALPGSRNDGHSFLEEAQKRGALLAVVTREVENSLLPQLLVSDTMMALREMGRLALEAHRNAGHRLVALTGSVGKTTTKELIRLGLSATHRVHATRANENNEIGVPLTLLSWPADAPFCVLEAGVRKVSDIDYLAPLLQADVGIVTSVGPGHLEHLKTVAEVWHEKSKLLRCVVSGGTRIVPEPVRAAFPDDPVFEASESSLVVATFQTVEGKSLKTAQGRIVETSSGLTLTLSGGSGFGELSIPLSRPSMALAWCVLLALLAVRALGEDVAQAAGRMSEFEGVPGRMERRRLSSGLLLLLDHYNANPVSMKEALSWLGREMSLNPSSRGFAVLGDMLELGTESRGYHEAMGEQAASLPLETLWYKGNEKSSFLTGYLKGGGDPGKIRSADSFGVDIAAEQGPSGRDILLVKASRGIKLEDVIAPLLGKE